MKSILLNHCLDSPPKYGFLPNVYQQENPQNNSSNPHIYSGVALSYGFPIPYQEPLHSPTSESPEGPPYPLENVYPNLTNQTESTVSTELLDINTPKVDSSGKLFRNFFFLFWLF